MKNIHLFLLAGICFFFTKIHAQDTSIEQALYFNQYSAVDASYTTEAMTIKKLVATPFINLSGYVETTDFVSPLFYRIQSKKQWSDWMEFKQFTDGVTPERTTFDGEPLTEAVDQLQFKTYTKQVLPLICRLYFPGHSIKDTPKTAAAYNANCACEQPNICFRDCWCPAENCRPDPTPVSNIVTHIIVHHSAGQTNSDDFKAVLRSYWDTHVNTRRWDDIGYNWLVDGNGVIYEGRGKGRLGAHFSCMNENTTGVCVIGNYETVNPTKAALNSLKDIIAWEACDGAIEVDAIGYHIYSQLDLEHLSGHRDGGRSPIACSTTVCPGDSLYKELPALRAEIASLPCMSGIVEDSTMTTSTIELMPNYEINIQPNPTKGAIALFIKMLNSEVAKWSVSDILGNKKIAGQVITTSGENFVPLDLRNASNGIYFLTIEIGNSRIQKKILKIE